MKLWKHSIADRIFKSSTKNLEPSIFSETTQIIYRKSTLGYLCIQTYNRKQLRPPIHYYYTFVVSNFINLPRLTLFALFQQWIRSFNNYASFTIIRKNYERSSEKASFTLTTIRFNQFINSQTNSVHHKLICKLGGYTSMRHNSVRYYHAQIMREVCRDIQTKPTLLPINKNDFERKVKSADKARLDISVKGLWKSCEKHSLT